MNGSKFPGIALLGVAVAALVGCGDRNRIEAPAGAHRHESVHGGVAVELGEHEFQLDVLADPALGELRVWTMDAHLEDFVRLPLPSFEVVVRSGGSTQSLTLGAQANAATGEKVGETSLFAGQAEWLKGLSRFTAVVPRVEIRGRTFEDVKFSYPATR